MGVSQWTTLWSTAKKAYCCSKHSIFCAGAGYGHSVVKNSPGCELQRMKHQVVVWCFSQVVVRIVIPGRHLFLKNKYYNLDDFCCLPVGSNYVSHSTYYSPVHTGHVIYTHGDTLHGHSGYGYYTGGHSYSYGAGHSYGGHSIYGDGHFSHSGSFSYGHGQGFSSGGSCLDIHIEFPSVFFFFKKNVLSSFRAFCLH